MTDADRGLRELVRRHGRAIMKVAEDEQGPGFAYTVGLYRAFAHPEIILFGLRPALMQALLNQMGRDVADGAQFAPGSRSTDVLRGYAVEFRAVDRAAHSTYLGAAVRFYDGSQFSAVHCVWPDQAGRFPWHSGVTERFRWSQPALSCGPERTTTRPPAV